MSRAAQVAYTIHELAGRAFARHEVRVLTEDRVVCGRPGSTSYAFEVARLGWGRVIVHGDLEPVVFRGGDGGGFLDKLAWLAGSDRAYLAGKSQDGAHRAARGLGLGWDGGHGYVPRASLLWAHEAARVAFALLRPEDLLARFLDAPSAGGLALYNSSVRAHRASDPGRIAAARAEAAHDVARVRRAAARGRRP